MAWLESATRTQVAASADRGHGYQWWTMGGGTFAAIGIHGKLLYIDPARRLVVAINSAWPEAASPERSGARKKFLSLITDAVDSER